MKKMVMNSQERGRRSELMRNLWKDPEFRKKRDAVLFSREVQQRKGASMSRVWRQDGYSERVRERISNAERKPEVRAAKAAQMHKYWDDPEAPERRRVRSNKMKKLWREPEYGGHKHLAEMRTRWAAQATKNWQNPEVRKKMLTHLKSRKMRKMTSDRCKGTTPAFCKLKCPCVRHAGIVMMRTTWEVAYAQFLDRFNIAWEYEARYIYVGEGPWIGRRYIPDFYLPDFDMFVEIKGFWMWGADKKVEAVCKRYPSIRLRILEQHDLEELGIKFNRRKQAVQGLVKHPGFAYRGDRRS